MKQCLAAGLVFLWAFLITSCSLIPYKYPQTDYTHEVWQYKVTTQPIDWKRGASNWFLTGDPTIAEQIDSMALPSAAISTTMVSEPNFNKISVNGDFKVQIFGTDEANSVYVYGANVATRAVAVSVVGDTLYLNQTSDTPNMKNVIVRIGVNNLTQIQQCGRGTIEGIQIRSTGLKVITTPSGCGNIYLSGCFMLNCIIHKSTGRINVFNAMAAHLAIASYGSGAINVCGDIGLSAISHVGNGDINIIGAKSNGLRIEAKGEGQISINGTVNLQYLSAKENIRVYIYYVASCNANIILGGEACVGLAGYTNTLHLEAYDGAQFAGRFFNANEAYVKAYDLSHVNVTAQNLIYAHASGNGSIYYFGSPSKLTKFEEGYGTVIPVWSDNVKQYPPGFAVMKVTETVVENRPPPYPQYRWKNKRLVEFSGQG